MPDQPDLLLPPVGMGELQVDLQPFDTCLVTVPAGATRRRLTASADASTLRLSLLREGTVIATRYVRGPGQTFIEVGPDEQAVELKGVGLTPVAAHLDLS